MSNRCGFAVRFVLPLSLAISLGIVLAAPNASCKQATNVSGCELLSNPSAYNGKLVVVTGLAKSDFEHFDLRFHCDGSIQLETSERAADIQKFGFKTKMDSKYHQLMRAVENRQALGPNCLQCVENTKKVHVRIRGMFRCHYDFPDCSNVSRHGDSSIVIMRIESVNVDRPAKTPPSP
jgi:hypothetical protein